MPPVIKSTQDVPPPSHVALIDYFVKMGLTPAVAVDLAAKIGSTSPPITPIANGVRPGPIGVPPGGAVNVQSHVQPGQGTSAGRLDPLTIPLNSVSVSSVSGPTRQNRIKQYMTYLGYSPEDADKRVSQGGKTDPGFEAKATAHAIDTGAMSK